MSDVNNEILGHFTLLEKAFS